MDSEVKKSPSDIDSEGSVPVSPERFNTGGIMMTQDMMSSIIEKITSNFESSLTNINSNFESSFASLKSDMKTEIGTVKTEMISVKNEIVTDLDRKLQNLTERFENRERELDARIGTVEAEVGGRIDTVKQTCDHRSESTKQALVEVDKRIVAGLEETKNLLTGRLGNTECNLKQKIEQVEEKVNSRISNLELWTASGNASWPLMQMPNGKTFSGEGKYHAVDFIASCKDQFIPGMTDQNKIKIAKRSLEGSVLTWANQCAEQFVTFEDFEKLFLSKYWSEAKQIRLQSEFLNGPVYVGGKQTMKKFCEDELEKLVHLDKQLGTLTIISTLCRRLPEDLNWQLIHCPTDSIENFLNFIEKIDHAMTREARPRENQHIGYQKEHNDNRGNKNWGYNQKDYHKERNANENWRNSKGRNNWENNNQRGTWENDRNDQRSGQEGGSRTGEFNRRENQGQNLGN